MSVIVMGVAVRARRRGRRRRRGASEERVGMAVTAARVRVSVVARVFAAVLEHEDTHQVHDEAQH